MWVPYATFGIIAAAAVGAGGWRAGAAMYAVAKKIDDLSERVVRIEQHLKLP